MTVSDAIWEFKGRSLAWFYEQVDILVEHINARLKIVKPGVYVSSIFWAHKRPCRTDFYVSQPGMLSIPFDLVDSLIEDNRDEEHRSCLVDNLVWAITRTAQGYTR